ncbi:MAG: septal ring lytic transglycosylase RlpA family protein [Sphingobacteriaceae bacterium]|nr:septal ring lytic transglycosylase RlpA family protein [Cytophagaceae bacterium]
MSLKSVLVFGWLLLSRALPAEAQLGKTFTGKASFYAKKFQGKLTACGEKFKEKAMTAAHLHLPFGTMVEVTNLRNRKKVVVRINDRGPFRRGRVLDLTNAAARQIGILKAGVANVACRIVGLEGVVMLGPDEYIIHNSSDIVASLGAGSRPRPY